MKTLGQIAYENYHAILPYEVSGWSQENESRRQSWERAAKAVLLAQEGTMRKTSECEGRGEPTPKGTESPYSFGCLVPSWDGWHLARVIA